MWIVCTIIGVPTLYVLSYGPALHFIVRYPDTFSPLEKFYSPIKKAVWSDPIYPYAAPYMDWWSETFGGPLPPAE